MANWAFSFTANDTPDVYIPNLNLLRTNAQDTGEEVIAARGLASDLSEALEFKANVGHTHDAAALVSGTIAAARLAAGVADSTKWLRGDQTWQPLPGVSVSTLDQSGATDGQVLAWSDFAGAWGPISPAAAGAVSWGSVVGTLSAQADLQAALDAKSATGHTHDASAIVSGSLSVARIPSLPGSIIGSGTVAAARLGSGTPGASVWLRGDGTWAALPPASGAAWGTITGSIGNQSDLDSALQDKAPLSHVGAANGAHPNATPVSDGFMSAANAAKLAGIAAGATANSTDAVLLSRANHLGTQPISTVEGLSDWLATRASLAANTFSGNQTAPDFISTSDARLKTDVSDLKTNGHLRPVRYTMINTGRVEVGFIAQEVLEICPEAVHELQDGILAVAYPRLIAVLAAEIVELRERVNRLAPESRL